MEQKQLDQLVVAVQQGALAGGALYAALHTFGRQHYLQARQVVESCLASPNPAIRKIALHVLANYWRLTDHWETACAALRDPDSECRMQGASALGALKRNTRDPQTLCALAGVVDCQGEVQLVREAAYAAMRSIIHYDPPEQFRLACRGIAIKEMDWEMVKSYLPHERGEAP